MVTTKRKHKPLPRNQKPRAKSDAGSGVIWIYGRHAVGAALANPARQIKRVLATKNAADWLSDIDIPEGRHIAFEDAKPDAIDKVLPQGAVHQGLAAAVTDLPRTRLKDICAEPSVGEPVVILDQVTDPQNIGAVFRVAAAFHARAVIVQERRTPPLAGALAKAAAGAVESVPCIKVVNISRAIEALVDLGYTVAGFAGEADETIADLPKDTPVALVLGAEGSGLRPLVAETCDRLVRIPIAPQMESLNVSTAAAIGLYEATRK